MRKIALIICGAMMIASTMPTFAQTVYVEYSEKINADLPTQLSLKLDNKPT